MKRPKEIIKFLDDKKIKYEFIEHRTVYTAFDKSATLKILPKTVGKTLIVKLNKDYALILIAADQLLDLSKLKKAANQWLKQNNQKSLKAIQFIKEAWMKKNLKGMQPGAIPPFGEIWNMPTFVDKNLLKQKKLIVNAGDYNLSISISPANLSKIQDLVIASFGKKKPKPKKKKSKPKAAKKK